MLSQAPKNYHSKVFKLVVNDTSTFLCTGQAINQAIYSVIVVAISFPDLLLLQLAHFLLVGLLMKVIWIWLRKLPTIVPERGVAILLLVLLGLNLPSFAHARPPDPPPMTNKS